MRHRYFRRRKLTPRQEKLRQEYERAWMRSDALAIGYAEKLKQCDDEVDFQRWLDCLNTEVTEAFAEQTRADKAFQESLKRKPSKKAVAAA